jgi:hypothetical protein
MAVLVIFFGALVALGIAANLFGADSREAFTSREHQLARLGFTRG